MVALTQTCLAAPYARVLACYPGHHVGEVRYVPGGARTHHVRFTFPDGAVEVTKRFRAFTVTERGEDVTAFFLHVRVSFSAFRTVISGPTSVTSVRSGTTSGPEVTVEMWKVRDDEPEPVTE